MNLHRTWAIFRKEVIHVRRDPISLLEIILLPLILMLLYGYALTFDIKKVSMAVYDQEGSQLSEELVSRFKSADYFDLTRFARSYAELQDLVARHEVQVGLVSLTTSPGHIKPGRPPNSRPWWTAPIPTPPTSSWATSRG